MFTRVRVGCVIQICQNKNPREKIVTGGCEWRHAPEACAEDFGRFEKSQLVEIETWARTDEFVRYGRRTCCGAGADGKISIERWYLSPYVEKPFNSKVIKSFVPELRSRKCFSCFRIPMFYVYVLWTFYIHFTYSCMAMLQPHKIAAVRLLSFPLINVPRKANKTCLELLNK